MRGDAGGVYKRHPEDFEVEELSLFDPDGRPGHLFLWIEKRGLSTLDAVRHLAQALEVPGDAVGYAGMKDAFACTRQWVSVPAKAEPRLGRVERVRVLRMEANGSKLRTGELAGNRFRLLLRGAKSDAIARWLDASGALVPNYFGPQRFGDAVDTHLFGLSLLRGEIQPRRGRMLRLALSAAQSALFNAYLASRVEASEWNRWIDGDVVLRPDGRDFYGAPEAAREAVNSGRARVAGPIFGPHMKPARAAAATLEAAVLGAAGLKEDDFAGFRKLTAGTRRATACALDDVELDEHDGHPRLCFTLPPGTYATTVLDALGVAPATAEMG